VLKQCRALLEHGADARIKDKQGKTALMWAEERGHTSVARTLSTAAAPGLIPVK